MKRELTLILIAFLFSGGFCLADCPSADLTGDCFVDYEDFALMANQWLATDPCIPDDMVRIPGGTFEMGDSFGDDWSHELPVHTVTVDSFYMGKYEITNQKYCDYLNSTYDACDIKVEGGIVYAFSDDSNSYPYCNTHSVFPHGNQIEYSGGVFSVRMKLIRDMSYDPMVEVTWYGTAAYCNWRSQEEGYEQCYDPCDPNWPCDFSKSGYRLPTEAEWEYVARGGEHDPYFRFPWGDTISHSQANYYSYWEEGSSYYAYDVNPYEGYHPTWNDGIEPYTSPVGSFAANGYGLYDVAGNAWEWCNDWYDSTYYVSRPNPDVNPTGPSGPLTYRVLRGGSWGYDARGCRVAGRGRLWPDVRGHTHSFRIVLDLEPASPLEPDGMVWVDINDPGVSGHEGFVGEMSKYETTNAQYCEFLNAALNSNDITVDGDYVKGADGSNGGADFVGEIYYNLVGSGVTYNGATNGAAARINYTGSSFTVDSGFENHPVTYVSWYGSTAFCDYYGWRLPTEWEWQAVADYDGSYTYGCGTSINNSIANYRDSTHPDGTTVAGSFGTYGYGVCDMAGNMWEWTDSWYEDSDTHRVLRGGCWSIGDYRCTVSSRYLTYPYSSYNPIGFRVCR